MGMQCIEQTRTEAREDPTSVHSYRHSSTFMQTAHLRSIQRTLNRSFNQAFGLTLVQVQDAESANFVQNNQNFVKNSEEYPEQ
jgi:hypothetical protein